MYGYEEWLTDLLIKNGIKKPLTMIVGSHFEHGRRYGHIGYIIPLGWVITDAAVRYLKRKQKEKA